MNNPYNMKDYVRNLVLIMKDHNLLAPDEEQEFEDYVYGTAGCSCDEA